MPNIRIMLWNIEQMSWNKAQIPGMVQALSRTVVSQNVDLLVVLEIRTTNVANIMNALAFQLNADSLGANAFRVWFLSHPTGFEHYGFFVRDLNTIRPLAPIHNGGLAPVGTQTRQMVNLDAYQFSTWPGTFAAMANAFTGWPHPGKPQMPLVDLFARTPPSGRKRKQFSGQPLSGGTGLSLGRGYRLPCMALFQVRSATAGNPILPIVVCHFAATRSPVQVNFLANAQVRQLPFLHIAQKFRDGAGNAGFLDVNNAAAPVREIVLAGDFNMDFLQNSGAAAATRIQRNNRNAYGEITPTEEQVGTATPGALPGAVPAAPGVPFAFPPVNLTPFAPAVPRQSLKSAATTEGTMLHHYNAMVVPANANLALRGACFDNFIFGGTQLAGTVQINFGTGLVDAGDVYNVPGHVTQTGAALGVGDFDINPIATHFTAAGTRHAGAAPNLLVAAGGGPALTANDRLIGARMVSDHLPVTVQLNIP